MLLGRKSNIGGRDLVLLVGREAFTRGLVTAYESDILVVVGTRDHNGYTDFKNMTTDGKGAAALA